MTFFHVCNTITKSGIARYALDFQRLVLGPQGYELIPPHLITSSWIAERLDKSTFHIQLGALQFAERRALSRILATGRHNVEATLHDPPLLTFPYFSFESTLAMKLSRGFDWYLNSFGIQSRTLRRLRRVFVLSQKGEESLAKFRLENIVRIPHIVASEQIWSDISATSNDIIYFGFIGPSKGIDYALRLHQQLRTVDQTIRIHVIGGTNSPTEEKFLADLKCRFFDGVVYHGYVPEDDLDAIFTQARHVFLPFEQYRYLNPASGSIINALKRGRIVWSTPVNAVPELIVHGVNGMLLSKNLEQDARQFLDLNRDPVQMNRIASGAIESARAMSSYPYKAHFTPTDSSIS